jgi:hypothetical protein
MNQPLTLIAPSCACCSRPAPLLPRDDLPGGLAVCPATGQLYQPAGAGYIPAELPALSPQPPIAASVQIDLSQSGYA